MKLTITVQGGSLAGQRFDLTEGFLTIGRGASCNVVFDPAAENMVSTKHAYIEAKADGFYLVDSTSTNGTFVNGNRVQVVKLNPGDRIQFGKNGPESVVALEAAGFQSQPVFQSAPDQFAPSAAPGQFQQPQFAQSYPNAGFDALPEQPQNLRNSMSFIGLSAPVVKVEEKSNTGKYIGAAIAILAFVFLGLVAMLLIVSSVGIVPAVFASFVAFAPAVVYILPLMFLDRYDPEPPWLLASAFAWGAIVAVVFSFIVNTAIGIGVAMATQDPGLSTIASAVISAPIFEEGSKGLGVLILLIFFRREFDDILDGIVYGGTIALGFATVENVLYYGRGIAEGGSEGLVLLFVLRGIMSPFAHVTFTSMTGIGCGISRESHNKIVRILMPLVGYCGAVALHMFWNGMATFGGLQGFFVGYLVLEVPFFLIFVGFAFYIMHRQNKILREMLAIDAARGLITDEQLKTVTSAFKSTAWLIGGIFSGKFFARSRFLRSAGKLGLSYWHIQRATAAQGQTGSFQTNPILRSEVEKWRDKV